MRIVSACTYCRSRKRKCVALPSGLVCTICNSNGRNCDITRYRPSRKPPRASRNPPAHSPQCYSQSQPSARPILPEAAVGTDILNHPVLEELIELFFDMIHNKQLIVFHRNSFLNDRMLGNVPKYHLLGIASIVARFSSNLFFKDTEPTERGLSLAKIAKQDFDAREVPISVQALQGSILLAFAFSVEGQSEEEALLSAQALCMVEILELPKRSQPGTLCYEIEVRLFWHAFLMDVWHRGRDQFPRRLQEKATIPLPLEEEFFESLRPDEAVGLGSAIDYARYNSIMSNVVRLHATFSDVIQLNHMLVNELQCNFIRDREVQRLSSELDQWLQDLPNHLRNTPENLQTFASQSRGREFAMLHIIYHHQSQLLYYQFLQKPTCQDMHFGDRKQSAWLARCKAHAEALSALMWTTNTLKGSECLWSPVNGHLLVVASTVHLHSLLFDNDPSQSPNIRRLLEQNFVMLLQFQKYWPTLKTSLSRLAVFHRSCYRQDCQESFKLDQWMFNFLTKHDVAIDERARDHDYTGQLPVKSPFQEQESLWPWLSDEAVSAQNHLYASLSFSQV